MRYYGFRALATVLVAAALGAQTPVNSDEPVRVGPGVTPPRLIRKIEPEYSPEAQANRVQGTVVLQLVVTQQGRAADISVISPLGFGLDEKARSAVEKWEFAPGMKAGVPVKVLATVEVNFRFQGIRFDEKTENQRTLFNEARQTLAGANSPPAAVDRAVQSVMDLSRQKYAPAMYIAGSWIINGEHFPKDAAQGLDLIQRAAAKNYAQALYDVASRRIDGRDLPPDMDKGLKDMRAAATLGSPQAQYYLAKRYEGGNGVPRELDSAERYYRLCSAQSVALCQYRLGRLLYDSPERKERDYLQAVALFELAAGQGLTEAKELAAKEVPQLTPEQTAWVAKLEHQIVQK